MENLFSIDRSLFLFINHLPHSAMLNSIAMLFSGIGQWGAVWFIIAIVLFFREEEKDHWFFAPFIFSGIVAWIVSEVIVKHLFLRPRPSEAIGAIILTTPGNFSFPSTHATLAWAMAIILAREEPRLKWAFYLLATVICLSRIYLGAHYPLDVIIGSLLGLGIGKLAMTLEFQWSPRKSLKKRSVHGKQKRRS